MKILIITQKIDENDDVLGFFSSWLNELGKKIGKIYVVVLTERSTALAKNIELYPLGKGGSSNRLMRLVKFNYYLAKIVLNKRVDMVFVHMCPEYVFLAFPYAKLARVPMVMWYAHGHTNLILRIAYLLVDKIITPSKESFRIWNNKVIITGHGIDINRFKIEGSKFKVSDNEKKLILSVGRISPIKNYETLIEAANILVYQRNIRNLRFQIAGGVPVRSQEKYLGSLKQIVSKYRLEDYIELVGPIPYTQIHSYYQNCDLFVSTSDTGSLDKAVLEAMACAKPILTSNAAFSRVLDGYSDKLMFEKRDAFLLTEKIISILSMNEAQYQKLGQELRNIVVEEHSLIGFIEKIVRVFQEGKDIQRRLKSIRRQSISLKISAFLKLIIKGEFKYLYGCIRRRFIFYFVRDYFNSQMLRRKGTCSLSGHCCKITLPWCVYLKNGRCSMDNKQPFFCKVFPIDEKDKELSDVKELCSYYFD